MIVIKIFMTRIWSVIWDGNCNLHHILHYLTILYMIPLCSFSVKLKSALGFDPLLKDLKGEKSRNELIVENTSMLKYSEQYKVRTQIFFFLTTVSFFFWFSCVFLNWFFSFPFFIFLLHFLILFMRTSFNYFILFYLFLFFVPKRAPYVWIKEQYR